MRIKLVVFGLLLLGIVTKINKSMAQCSIVIKVQDSKGNMWNSNSRNAPILLAGEIEIKGIIQNKHDIPINSFDLKYSVDGFESNICAFKNLDIKTNEEFDFVHSKPVFIEAGNHNVVLVVENINGNNNSKNICKAELKCANEFFSKNVVYEERTGTWCGYCPRGLVGLNIMAHKYTDGSWIGIAVHNADPMLVPEYDQGVAQHTESFPGGVLNRKDVADPGISILEEAYLEIIQEVALSKIDITSQSWDPDTRNISVETTTNFAMDLSGIFYNLAMVIVENEVTGTSEVWNQANYYSGGGVDLIDWDGTNWVDLPNPVPAADMVYNHVGRVIVGGWNGIPNTMPSTVSYGTPYNYEFTYTLDESFNADNIDIVVLLIDAPSGQIVNAGQVHLGEDILNVDFLSNVEEGVAPLEVEFTDETQGGNVASWSWDFNNDGIEDSNEQNPVYTFETAGTYTVKLTVTNEAGSSFAKVKNNLIHTVVGLKEISKNNIRCFPNPANDIIHIESKETIDNIKLYNSLGQLVYFNEQLENKFLSVNIKTLERGVYYLELNTEREKKTTKVIIE